MRLEARTLGLGATNSWFATRLRVFSLPRADDEVTQRVAENWGQLSLIAGLPDETTAKKLLPSMSCWPDLEPYGVDAVWKAILSHNVGSSATAQPDDLDLATPEWEAFTRPQAITMPDFTTKREQPPAGTRQWLREVTLVPRLREVSALFEFTRIDAPKGTLPPLTLNASSASPAMRPHGCRAHRPEVRASSSVSTSPRSPRGRSVRTCVPARR